MKRAAQHNRTLTEACLKFSLGSKSAGKRHGEFDQPAGLVFDSPRGYLLVADRNNQRVQMFTSEDGSFVGWFGGLHQMVNPISVAIDDERDRVIVIESMSYFTIWARDARMLFQRVSESPTQHQLGFFSPGDVAVDVRHQRIIVADSLNNRVVAVSANDFSRAFVLDGRGLASNEPGAFQLPAAIAIDSERDRFAVADAENHRVQVLSSIDGSFLFEFGSQGDQPGQLHFPRGLCIANQGRIIVADTNNNRLQAFTHEGHHISSFDCGSELPYGVAFDEHRGLIAFSAGNRVHVIGANQWLAHTFTWRPDRHRYAPSWMKQVVLTMTMIRSLVDDSNAMSMIPNELLFAIFSYLGAPSAAAAAVSSTRKCDMM